MLAAVLLALSMPLVPPDTARAEPARVAAARKDKQALVEQMIRAQGLTWPAKAVLLRAFKSERVLELWAGDGKNPLLLVKSYPICASSGSLGPKVREGDMQVPEGVYQVDSLNPWSTFHLSLHVDYPNKADRARSGRARVDRLGGDIMVHGNCVTIGCIPIEDDPIEEVYLVVNDARASGARVHIHIFPARLDEAGLQRLARVAPDEDVHAFWREELAPVFRAFESSRRVPRVDVDEAGHYVVRATPTSAAAPAPARSRRGHERDSVPWPAMELPQAGGVPTLPSEPRVESTTHDVSPDPSPH